MFLFFFTCCLPYMVSEDPVLPRRSRFFAQMPGSGFFGSFEDHLHSQADSISIIITSVIIITNHAGHHYYRHLLSTLLSLPPPTTTWFVQPVKETCKIQGLFTDSFQVFSKLAFFDPLLNTLLAKPFNLVIYNFFILRSG